MNTTGVSRLRTAVLVGLLVMVPALQVVATLAANARHLGPLVECHGLIAHLTPLYAFHQNRLLGPALLESTQALTGLSGVASFRVLICALLAAFYVGVAVTWRRTPAAAVLMVLLTAQLHLVVLRGMWVWDLVDLLVFGALVLGVVRERAPGYFAAILAVEVLNREVALVIGVWLVLRYATHREWRTAGVFAAAVPAMAGLVWYLRGLAHVASPDPSGFIAKTGYPFCLPYNLRALGEMVVWWDMTIPLLVGNLALLVLACAWSGRRELRELSWLYGALWVTTLVVGSLDEPRLWVAFVPFVLLFVDDLRLRVRGAEV